MPCSLSSFPDPALPRAPRTYSGAGDVVRLQGRCPVQLLGVWAQGLGMESRGKGCERDICSWPTAGGGRAGVCPSFVSPCCRAQREATSGCEGHFAQAADTGPCSLVASHPSVWAPQGSLPAL